MLYENSRSMGFCMLTSLAQIEFFAEDELVTIVPNFSFETVNSMLHGLEVGCCSIATCSSSCIHANPGRPVRTVSAQLPN